MKETKCFGVLCNVFGKERLHWLFAFDENDAKTKTLNTPGFFGSDVLKIVEDDGSHIGTIIL